MPYVVFTEPQLGRIGISKNQAKEKGIPYRVSRLPASTIGRAVQTGETEGFVEVLVGDDDRLLGAAVFCEQGGEIMTMFQLAMAGGLRYQELENMIIAHPVWGEVLNNAFQRLKLGSSWRRWREFIVPVMMRVFNSPGRTVLPASIGAAGGGSASRHGWSRVTLR
nr:hypothetical protein [Hymenobacter siberiensis]